MNWFIVFFSLINLSLCIYEDQIGKFDWRQSYVGRIKLAQFDTSSTAKRLIVATEENVLAALNLKTGTLVWRQVLESASNGNIHMLQLSSDHAVTVSGSNPYFVRGWDLASGVLAFEWSLNLNDERQKDFSEWWVHNNRLMHLLPDFGTHLELTWYNLVTGLSNGKTSRIPASWVDDGCVFSAPYYTCVSGDSSDQLLHSLDVSSNALQIISKPLASIAGDSFQGILRPVDGNPSITSFILDDRKIIIINKKNEYELLKVKLHEPSASVTIVDSPNGHIVMQAFSEEARGFTLSSHYVSTGAEVPDMGSVQRSPAIAGPEIQAGVCTKGRGQVGCRLLVSAADDAAHLVQHSEGGPMGSVQRSPAIAGPEIQAGMCTKGRGQVGCRLLVSAADDAAHLVQHSGKVLWTREEALANVVVTEFVDLPVSDLEAAIESEFDQKEGSIWGAFTRRLQTQMQQLHTLLFETDKSAGGPEPLVRDYFNLHKMIVLVTEVGKIFGMDNLSGELLWQRYEPSLDTENVVMFLRRSATHPPLEAYLTIVGKHVETGNGLIISVNPIVGSAVGERVLPLDVQLQQCAVLPTPDAEKLHALVLLDVDNTVQVLPGSAAPLVENMFMYVADRNAATVQGYALKYDGRSVIAEKTWSINLGGSPNSGHKIVAAVGKPASERVHSAGKVLGDRSVLYKYSNPNLVLFITEGPDQIHKDVVIATCVDAVSGAVVAAQAHRRARASPFAVHADNFMAYLYYNDKHRRTEIATLELYEGKQRWLAAGAAFSSLSSERAPLVERQAYILSAVPTAAAITTTERSLTDKHVLLALSTGAIIEMPWAYLEARRPIAPTPEQREEGLIPYTPELPLPSEAVINYNRTLLKVRTIYTAPAGLESTCLVLATGLDLFYTRVAPSKTFDLLKDDFDYSLISIVLVALIVATYSTKYFASRKLLRMAWK